MIKFYKNTAIVLLVAIIYLLFPHYIFSESYLESKTTSVKGFDTSVFNYHFSKADREINPEYWLIEARNGINLAIDAWEKMATDFYNNEDEKNMYLNIIKAWSEEEIEKRFEQWLVNRFFGLQYELIVNNILDNISNIQKQYTYMFDDNGEIIYDENTKRPKIIRPSDENNLFDDDLKKWNEDINSYLIYANEEINLNINKNYYELLDYIDEDFINSVNEKARNKKKSIAKLEIENIISREERIFIANRLGDIYSLRKKSENEDAATIVNNIIEKTNAVINADIASLQTKIEQALTDPGDISVYGEDWLLMYQNQFEKGLKIWEEAEEMFFVRRIEWENEAQDLFENSSEIWIKAFEKFEEEREKWEKQIIELFESGVDFFHESMEMLENNIYELRKEIQKKIKLREDAEFSKTNAIFDMYFNCVNYANYEWDNAEYWLKLIDDELDLNFIIKNNVNEWIDENYVEYEDNELKIDFINEFKYSIELYNIYLNKSNEIYNNLINDYLDLFGKDDIKEIINNNIYIENMIIDEYIIALIKAKYQMNYWEKKYDIAKAVNEYATELTAGRMTEEEGLIKWSKAKEEYENAINYYESEIEKLNDINMMLDVNKENLDNILKSINKLQEQLNICNNDYMSLISTHLMDNKQYFENEIKKKYENLYNYYSIIISSNNNDRFYTEEFRLLDNFYKNRDLLICENVINDIIYGNDEEGILSIDSLEKILNNLRIILEDDEFPKDVDSLGIDKQDNKYIIINNLILDYYENINEIEINEIEEIEEIKKYYINLINENIDSIKQELEINLKIKNMELKLVNNNNLSTLEWYCDAWNIDLLNYNREIKGIGLGDVLYEDLLNYYKVLLMKKIEIEKENLEIYKNYNENNIELDSIYIQLNALNILYERIVNNEYLIQGSNNLEQYIEVFISDESLFPLSTINYKKEMNDFILAIGLYNAFLKYSNISNIIINEEKYELINNVSNMFKNILNSNYEYKTNILPEYNTIFNMLYKDKDNLQNNLINILIEFDNIFQFIPEWMDFELNEWKSGLIEYIVINAINNNIYFKIDNNLELKYKNIDDNLYDLIEKSIIKDLLSKDKFTIEYNTLVSDYYKYYYYNQIKEKYELFNNLIIENRKHWRQLLSDFDEKNIFYGNSLENALILDTNDNNKYYYYRINNIFELYINNIIDRNIDIYENLELMIKENEKNEKLLSNYLELKFIIQDLGTRYYYSLLGHDDYDNELEEINKKKYILENEYNDIKEQYYLSSNEMMDIIEQYNEQYYESLLAYKKIEEERHEFEKQEAIRRWASTSYLDTDLLEINYCEDKYEKAKTIYKIFENLYLNNKEIENIENNEYYEYLIKYEDNFRDIMLGTKLLNAVNKEISEIKYKYEEYYYLNKSEIDLFSGYISYLDFNNISEIVNYIYIDNGILKLNYNDKYILENVNDEELLNIIQYSNEENNESIFKEFSQFQNDLIELSIRMNEYFKDKDKIKQFGLAKDYLLRMIKNANKNVHFLDNVSLRTEELKLNGSLYNIHYKPNSEPGKYILGEYIWQTQYFFYNLQEIAWIKMSDEEKKDLEFYTILTLLGNNDYLDGFYLTTAVEELDLINNILKYYNEIIEINILDIFSYFKTKNAHAINFLAMDRIKTTLNITKQKLNYWQDEIKVNISNIITYNDEYEKLNNLLNLYIGKNTEKPIYWDDINKELRKINILNNDELLQVEYLWNEMNSELEKDKKNIIFYNINKAIIYFKDWIKKKGNEYKEKINEIWINEKTNQINDEASLNKLINEFMEGTITEEKLEEAIKNIYNNDTSSWKMHYDNLEKILFGVISEYKDYGIEYNNEFNIIEKDYADLMKSIIGYRYNYELNALETEWNMQRQELNDKLENWKKTYNGILEKGNDDWDKSNLLLKNNYERWLQNFKNEYDNMSLSWNEAYLCNLEDKENWLNNVSENINKTMNMEMLNNIVNEAERYSRIMDTRGISGKFNDNSLAEAASIINDILNKPGIGNLSSIMNSISYDTDTPLYWLKKNINNIGIYDSNTALIEASLFAYENNKIIAGQEGKILALNVKETAKAAIENVINKIDNSNNQFRKSMDDLFIKKGQWNKSGNDYIKDIVKGSTLTQAVIKENKKVIGYQDFDISPIQLKTNIDEKYLNQLDSTAINIIIENIKNEVEDIIKDIFGDGSYKKISKEITTYERVIVGYEEIEINNTTEKNGGPNTKRRIPIYENKEKKIKLKDRDLGSGKFGEHIGYEPAFKNGESNDKKNMFYDQGTGQSGKLITDYLYWSVIDGKGNAEIGLAPWDKRLWDDTDKKFKAPTLRSITNFAVDITVGALLAAGTFVTGGLSTIGLVLILSTIGTSDELLFNGLDAQFGYKTAGEALFSTAKTFANNVIKNRINLAFNGIPAKNGEVFSEGINKLISNSLTSSNLFVNTTVKTITAGAQTLMGGISNNFLDSFTYDRKNGFGFNTNIFQNSMKNLGKSVLSSMVNAGVNSILKGINSGYDMGKIQNWRNDQINSIQNLNSLLGSLAGEGINYAFGDGFKLNLLNTSLFGYLGFNTKYVNSGLLEMTIGKNGFESMSIGSGGANVSIDNVLNAVKGAGVLGMNTIVKISQINKDYNVTGVFQTVIGFGDKKQKKSAWDVIFGKADLEINEEGEEGQEGFTITDKDGKKTITLYGKKNGASMDEQMRMGVIFGFETYRDGFGVGDIDNNGNIITQADNDNELFYASVKMQQMGIRVNDDKPWFYALNGDIYLESMQYKEMLETGNFQKYQDYLNATHINDKDNFFIDAYILNGFQNEPGNGDIILIRGYSRDEVIELNAERKKEAYNKYLDELMKNNNFTGSRDEYIASLGGNPDDMYNDFTKNKELLAENDYNELQYYSLLNAGCVLYSVKYAYEYLTGKSISGVAFNKLLNEAGLFDTDPNITDPTRGSDIGAARFVNILNKFSDGSFNASVETWTLKYDDETKQYKYFTYADIEKYLLSPDVYIGHMRVKGPESVTHSTLFESLRILNENTMIVNVKNSYSPKYNPKQFNSSSTYSFYDIVRFDFIKIEYANNVTPPSYINNIKWGLRGH